MARLFFFKRSRTIAANVALCFAASAALAQSIGWREAVIRLTDERSKVIVCVGLLKKYGDNAAVAKASDSYAAMKTQMDEVIEALIAVAGQTNTGQHPLDIPGAEARLKEIVDARRAFCSLVEPLASRPGEKNIFLDIMRDTFVPLTEAIREILNYRTDDPLEIATNQTELEAAQWPDFAKVEAAN